MGTSDPREDTTDEPTARAVARSVGDILREIALEGAAFFAVLLVVMGLLTAEPVWIVTAAVTGGVGAVVPFVAMRRRWSAAAQWTVALVGVVVALALASVVWTATRGA